MKSRLEVRVLTLSREVGLPLLNLNELGKKPQTPIILGNFVNNP